MWVCVLCLLVVACLFVVYDLCVCFLNMSFVCLLHVASGGFLYCVFVWLLLRSCMLIDHCFVCVCVFRRA